MNATRAVRKLLIALLLCPGLSRTGLAQPVADTLVQPNGTRLIFSKGGDGYVNPAAPFLHDSLHRLPAFTLIPAADTSHPFTNADLPAGAPVMVAWINPDCSHCIDEAIRLRLALDSNQLGPIGKQGQALQVVLVAPSSMALKLQQMVRLFRLDRAPARQLHIGWEQSPALAQWYGLLETPFNAWYGSNGRLVHYGVQDFDINKLKAWVKTQQ